MQKSDLFRNNLFNKSLLTKALLSAVVLSSAQASAAGFQASLQSASALGVANAGLAANTENAAVIGSNPAAAASFDKFAFSLGAAYVDPTVETSGDNNPLAPYYGALNDLLTDDIAMPNQSDYDVENSVNSSVIPSFYAVIPVGKKMAIGIASYTNYGTDTEFPQDYAAGLLGGSTKLTTVNFNPSLAFKVGSKLRLGVGAQVVYGTAELERNVGDGAAAQVLDGILTAAGAAGSPTAAVAVADFSLQNPQYAGALAGLGRSAKAFSMEGDDVGFGWNAGLLLDLNANHKIGLSYRSEVELEFEGDYENYLDPTKSTQGNLDLSLPAMAELGGFHRFGNVALQYGVLWTEWSSFEGLKGVDGSGNVLFEKAYSYDDNLRYSLGLSYYLGDKIILRAGYALDEQAGDTTISIPDSQRHMVSTGLTLKLGERMSIDLATAYLQGEEVSFTELDNNTGLTYAFTNKAEAVIGSAQFNMLF